MTEHIVLYGKGGVGKSTLTSNISAALAEAGFNIMQVGCDPKADSCTTLNSGFPIPTLFDLLASDETRAAHTVIHHGFKGVITIEMGAAEKLTDETTGVAIHRGLTFLQTQVINRHKPDFVLYDISSENKFPAYYHALNSLGAKRLFIITTADFMALNAANNIIGTLEQFGTTQVPIPFGGLIPNGIGNSFEDTFISDFAKHTSTRTLSKLPRSLMVRQCELYGKTVIEASPLSNQAYFYRKLANQIVDESRTSAVNKLPSPMQPEDIRSWAREWADRLYALENGLVTDGAAI